MNFIDINEQYKLESKEYKLLFFIFSYVIKLFEIQKFACYLSTCTFMQHYL